MEKDQINYMNMTDAVMSNFNSSKTLWENKAPISSAIQIIEACRIEISGKSFDQASIQTKGTTADVNAKIASLAEVSFGVVQRLRPYALASDNKVLYEQVDFAMSDLTQCSQLDTINRSKVVYAAATKHLADLAAYELTQEELDGFEAAIDGVALLSGNRDAMIGKRKTATDQIPVLIQRIRTQFDILDDLVPVLINDKTFVETYNNNRRIIDRK